MVSRGTRGGTVSGTKGGVGFIICLVRRDVVLDRQQCRQRVDRSREEQDKTMKQVGVMMLLSLPLRDYSSTTTCRIALCRFDVGVGGGAVKGGMTDGTGSC